MSFFHLIRRLRETKVLENYSFMTALNVLSALIGFLIYPYVIHVTGAEAFGVYPYALVWVGYFQLIIEFGFDQPAAKAIVSNRDDDAGKQKILSVIFTAKTLLFFVATILFVVMVLSVGDMRQYKWVYLCAFMQSYANVLYPVWYFQGMKNMRVVTYINLACRLLTVPAIILLIHSGSDIWIYALIVSVSMLAGGVAAWFYIGIHDGLRIRFVRLSELRPAFRDGLPFMMTGVAGQLKEGLMTTVVKMMFGYADVTLYDIAKKMVMIPRLFTQNINGALFPEVVDKAQPLRVRRILRYERAIGVAAALAITAVSYPLIWLLFGKSMMEAWLLTSVLCWTCYTWLVVGAYLNFVFIPQNRYYNITLNQVVALVSCLIFACAGLALWNNILVVVIAITLSGFVEIAYCRVVVRKNNLLSITQNP